jgi:hypothetical protein
VGYTGAFFGIVVLILESMSAVKARREALRSPSTEDGDQQELIHELSPAFIAVCFVSAPHERERSECKEDANVSTLNLL